jgi:hypothetical protein
MRITLFQKIIFITILFIFLSFFLPIYSDTQIDIILIPATFIFGSIYSFEILKVISNFSELKKHLATETANLVYMYHSSEIIGGDFAKAIKSGIEKYILTSIDYSLRFHISSTDKDFFDMAEPLKQFEAKGEKQKSAIEAIARGYHKVLEARYQLAQVAPREIGIAEWTMLILLTSILVLTLFLGRQANIISTVSAGIFASTVIGTLFLLDEADSNHIQETRLEYEVFNQVLEDVGQKPYYPQFALKRRIIKIPKNKDSFRLGIFPNYPDLTKREIEIKEKST